MHRKIAVLVAFALVASTLDRPGAARADDSLAPRAVTLAGVNQALDGRSATIVVASGPDILRATHVVVGSEITSWKADGRSATLPTSQVVRIRTDRHGMFARSFLTGVGIGAGSGLLAAAEVRSCTGWCIGPTPEEALAGGVVLGGAIGALVGALRHAQPSEVVFEGPVDRYAAAAAADPAKARARELARRLGF